MKDGASKASGSLGVAWLADRGLGELGELSTEDTISSSKGALRVAGKEGKGEEGDGKGLCIVVERGVFNSVSYGFHGMARRARC